jgi:hypothetical protein
MYLPWVGQIDPKVVNVEQALCPGNGRIHLGAGFGLIERLLANLQNGLVGFGDVGAYLDQGGHAGNAPSIL